MFGRVFGAELSADRQDWVLVLRLRQWVGLMGNTSGEMAKHMAENTVIILGAAVADMRSGCQTGSIRRKVRALSTANIAPDGQIVR